MTDQRNSVQRAWDEALGEVEGPSERTKAFIAERPGLVAEMYDAGNTINLLHGPGDPVDLFLGAFMAGVFWVLDGAGSSVSGSPSAPDGFDSLGELEATCDQADGMRHAIDPSRCNLGGPCRPCPGCDRCEADEGAGTAGSGGGTS